MTIRDLLAAGVHFGHQTRRWNPKMKRFIFGERSGVYIIDLEKTHKCLEEARRFVVDLTTKGGTLLFVGTKPQAKSIVEEESQRCGMFYVKERWLGGTLTNFQTIRRSVARYEEIERMEREGLFSCFTKKEVVGLQRERTKLTRYLRGIIEMRKLPGAVFVVDPSREAIAVHEANKLKIPVIAIADTNCNPDLVDYPLPGNDDAIRSVTLLVRTISDAALEGHSVYLKTVQAQKEAAEAERAAQEKARRAEEAAAKKKAAKQAAAKSVSKAEPVPPSAKEPVVPPASGETGAAPK